MGKINQGILGGFSGKVGPVVGSSWMGKAYMRARALSVKNPNTDAQQTVRNRLKAIAQFLSKVIDTVRVGFKNKAVGESAYNVATRLNLEEAVNSVGTAAEIDYTKVILAQGELLNPNNITVAADTAQGAHNIKLTWADNTGEGKYEKGTDFVRAILFNTDKQKALYTDAHSRSSATGAIEHPSTWAGDEAQVYVVTYQALGKLNSDSLRVGAVTCL